MGVKRKNANQFIPDPRQALFLERYLDPKSETFGSARGSAMKAGYSEQYADNLTCALPTWLATALQDNKRLARAEKRLDQILDFEPEDELGKIDNALVANQMKAITLVAKGLGKDRYSERTETDITSKGQKLEGVSIEFVTSTNEKQNTDSGQTETTI